MSSAFCSLDDAFAEPAMMPGKKKKSSKHKEYTVPEALSGSPGPGVEVGVGVASIPEPMRAPPGTSHGLGDQPEAGGAMQDFFPLPGKTAEPEEWAKAFMLDPSHVPAVKPDGSVPVAGKSTLWRNIQTPVTEAIARVPADIQQRLDSLTRQLDSLTVASPMQSTAELFLFIAIGLLFLLALDTLLRCATSIALSKAKVSQVGGAREFGRRWRS
jgi:hypothetical protein